MVHFPSVCQISDQTDKMPKMRAKIKSVRKINKIFLCIFTYIWKSDIFSTYLNFDEKWFFGHFKSQISKWPIHTKILPPTLVHKKFLNQNYKLISFHHNSETPCIVFSLICNLKKFSHIKCFQNRIYIFPTLRFIMCF